MLKKLTGDFILYSIGPQVPRVINFLMLPLFTKYLTSTDYGISGIIYSYIGLLAGIADLGLSIRYSITFFKYPKTWRNRWSVLTGILFRWSIVFSLLQLLILWTLLPHEMGSNKMIVVALSFFSALLFSAWNTLCINLLQFSQQSGVVTILNVCIGITAIALNYVFIVQMKLGYMGWFYTSFITTAMQGLFSLYWLFIHSKLKVDFSIHLKAAFKILVITFPLVFHTYASYLLDSSDRIIMRYLNVPIAEIGLYSFAYIFAIYFEFITASVGVASGPLFAKNFYSKSDLRYVHNKNLVIFFQIIFLALAFSISLLIKDFLQVFVSNKELWMCNYLVCVLVFAYSYKPLYWYVNTILSYNNKTGTLWKMTFTAGILNVILNIVLIPFIGIYACALSTLVCLVFMPLFGSLFRDFKTYNKEHFNFYFWIILIIALCSISLLLQNLPLAAKCLILLAVNLAAAAYVYKFYLSKIKVIKV